MFMIMPRISVIAENTRRQDAPHGQPVETPRLGLQTVGTFSDWHARVVAECQSRDPSLTG